MLGVFSGEHVEGQSCDSFEQIARGTVDQGAVAITVSSFSIILIYRCWVILVLVSFALSAWCAVVSFICPGKTAPF